MTELATDEAKLQQLSQYLNTTKSSWSFFNLINIFSSDEKAFSSEIKKTSGYVHKIRELADFSTINQQKDILAARVEKVERIYQWTNSLFPFCILFISLFVILKFRYADQLVLNSYLGITISLGITWGNLLIIVLVAAQIISRQKILNIRHQIGLLEAARGIESLPR